jgi:hypothetical protein
MKHTPPTCTHTLKFNDIGTAEVLVTAANDKLHILKAKLIENSQNLNRLRKKQKK